MKMDTIKKQNLYLENPHCLQENRLPARSVLIPATQKGVYYRNKEASSFLQSLNGSWQFCYCRQDCLTDFYKPEFDTAAWDVIDVPSMWQFRGYGKCSYPNVEYPIPFYPPYVMCENPVGYYKRAFFIKKCTARTVLHFGGVDNAFFVYVNGRYVGFSKGSRIPAEFDISAFVHDGENDVALKVFTYSDATYLENQDMLLANGIFRDVYLLHLNAVSLWDYRVKTSPSSFEITLQLTKNAPNCSVRLTLDGECALLKAEKEFKYVFQLENPRLWNAEQPNLYDLTIELLHGEEALEIHSKRIGIMHTKMEGTAFLVNGQPTYIKGINRHENNAKNGRYITVEQIEQELRMIKENNLNAIRCAHYTNHPAFYELASEIGLYVMDEADLETHGGIVTGDRGYLSKQPEWLEAYLDRVSRMLAINKNEPCIFMWSMGNECGDGENIDKCIAYTEAYDPTKAIMYGEGNSKREQDFRRFGYPSVEMLDNLPSDAPQLLVEYGHAMGNSPGFLQGYWDYIYTHKNFCGGFAWEFKSHGFYSEDENGNSFYKYGGDFDDEEKYHWYNFCLDGFLTSDGTPKPTWYELGAAQAPVYVFFDKDIEIMNTYDFTTLKDAHMSWSLMEDYAEIKSGCFDLPMLAPHERMHVTCAELNCMPEHRVPGAKYYLNLTFAEKGKVLGKRQLVLSVSEPKTPMVQDAYDYLVCTENEKVRVTSKNFEAEFCAGVLSKYIVDGKCLLDAPMQLCFYRATTDNDGVMCMQRWFPEWFYRNAKVWDSAFLKTMEFRWTETKVEQTQYGVCVRSSGKIIPDYEWLGFDATVEYRILKDGRIVTQITGTPFGNLPERLPRIGVCLALPRKFDTVEWYGRGKAQNYSDALLSAPVGLYSASADEMNFMFDMPQETGNREENAFVTVRAQTGEGVSIIGCDTFSFSYHPFTLENLNDAKHRNEIVPAEKRYLYIDYKMRGLGSRSCGPEPEEAFELHPHMFSFAFVLCAAQDKGAALEMNRTDYGVETKALSGTYVYKEEKQEKEVTDCKE